MNGLFIGLMSGTSLDGADAVVADLSAPDTPKWLGHAHHLYPDGLKQDLLALHHSGHDELHRAQRAGLELNIKGDIGWSLFPWLGLELHDTMLASARTPEQPRAYLWYERVRCGGATAKQSATTRTNGRLDFGSQSPGDRTARR